MKRTLLFSILTASLGAALYAQGQGGIVSTKAGMESWLGYGGYGRSPLPRPTSDENAKWKEGFRELIALEKSL